MSSPQSAITSPEEHSGLCSDLCIMLYEAGQRDTPDAALSVISGVLEDLTKDYPEISPLASEWRRLTQAIPTEQSIVPVTKRD